MANSRCIVPGCNNNSRTSGFCGRHYAQMLRHGKTTLKSPLDRNTICAKGDYSEIIITNRNGDEVARAIIDTSDMTLVSPYKWFVDKRGYCIARVLGKTTKLHKLLMGYVGEVDHINRNPLDNRRGNMRIVTRAQNCWNMRGKEGADVGYKGVFFSNKNKNRYSARIRHDGRYLYLGSFSTPIEAAAAYNEAALRLRGEYALINDLTAELPVPEETTVEVEVENGR